MAAGDSTSLTALLKRMYPKGLAYDLFAKSYLVAQCKKDTNFRGYGFELPVKMAPVAGASASATVAIANASGSVLANFTVKHRTEYAAGSLTNQVIQRAQGDGAVVAALKDTFDSMQDAWNVAMLSRCWGNAGGSLAKIKSISNATITLEQQSDALKFWEGMVCQFSSDDGTPSSPAGTNDSGATLTVSTVDVGAGTVTFGANLSTVTGTNTYVFRDGDYGAAMTGVPGWFPTTAPTSGESFFGLDRTTVDLERACGVRYNGNGAPMSETLINATAQAKLRSLKLTDIYMNPLDWAKLVLDIGTKRIVPVDTKIPGIGFRALQIEGADGTLNVFNEAGVPQGYAWILNTAEWGLHTAGMCPQVLIGQEGLWSETDDVKQFRWGAYGNFWPDNPGNAVAITF